MDKIIANRRSFIINFFYFAIIVGVYYFVVKYAFGYILPFVVATALAVFLQRPVRFISKKLHIKAHGAVSIILVLLIVILIMGVAGILGWVLVNEFKEFFTYIFSRFSSVTDVLDAVKQFLQGFIVKLPVGIRGTLNGYVTDIFSDFSVDKVGVDMEMLSAPLSGAWNVVKGIPSAFLSPRARSPLRQRHRFDRARRADSAIPTGQVSLEQTRIIMHPRHTRGAVAKPNSSAPRIAAIATSRPVISLPSVSMITLSRKPFNSKV